MSPKPPSSPAEPSLDGYPELPDELPPNEPLEPELVPDELLELDVLPEEPPLPDAAMVLAPANESEWTVTVPL